MGLLDTLAALRNKKTDSTANNNNGGGTNGGSASSGGSDGGSGGSKPSGGGSGGGGTKESNTVKNTLKPDDLTNTPSAGNAGAPTGTPPQDNANASSTLTATHGSSAAPPIDPAHSGEVSSTGIDKLVGANGVPTDAAISIAHTLLDGQLGWAWVTPKDIDHVVDFVREQAGNIGIDTFINKVNSDPSFVTSLRTAYEQEHLKHDHPELGIKDQHPFASLGVSAGGLGYLLKGNTTHGELDNGMTMTLASPTVGTGTGTGTLEIV